MRRLKHFSWENIARDSSNRVAFSSILSAPLLEDVEIFLPNIDFSDNATIIDKIERRDILRNLKIFEMVPSSWFSSVNELDNNASCLKCFTELRNAIDSIIYNATQPL
ncbi:Hypothetical predicted protein [Cloeon dipterum]|uniref:Uncharacterized protein n=1 Tax=Cloeon dipterum TaxID=197152 RepID=A0A8S1D8R8_9INSE|nr:Hypothetical predicted protein [Cloeon dipterum]